MPLKINYINKYDVFNALQKQKVKKVALKGLYPLCFLLGWFGVGTATHVITSVSNCLK